MLLCLIQALCGLTLTAAPQFARGADADGGLEAKVLFDGIQKLDYVDKARDAYGAGERKPLATRHFARVADADRSLEARVLFDGTVQIAYAVAALDATRVAERKIFLLRPACGGALQADLSLERGAIVLSWRRAGDARNDRPSPLGDRIRLSLEGDAFAMQRLPRLDAVAAGGHPGPIVCPADVTDATRFGAVGPQRLVHPPGTPGQD